MLLYALISNDPLSFPHLFICSLIEVYRSSSTTHALFFLVFIHRILLHLGLVKFPASEPVHIIALISATFLRQMATQMRASSKRPRVKPFSVTPPPPSFIGDTMAKESVDPTVVATTADVPPPSTSDDLDIRYMLETVMTVQATHGQILVDMLDELRTLQADLEHL